MTRSESARTLAERAFDHYIDCLAAGEETDVDTFVAQREPQAQDELRRMIEAYHVLRGRLGEGVATLQVGRQLGGFELVREIGRGGMAVVWEALEKRLNRRVALKVLAPAFSMSRAAIERFEREARAGGLLAHPGIVQTYGAGEADGHHFIAQELVPSGYTLDDLLANAREQRLLPDDWYRSMARFFVKVAEALSYAHEHGVIHRDVKPGNLLVADGDEPRVADFGLARIRDELSLSRTLELAGTPFYMSPEQASAKVLGVDHRTDVFSLGATFYEALTLTRPFEGDTSQQVFRKILMVDPPDPRAIRSRVPRDLAVIANHALEKDPDNRYQAMAEFAADLRRYLADEPIHATPPTRLDRCVKWVRRNPTKSTAGAIAAVAFVAITLLLVENVRARSDLSESNRALEAKTAEAVTSAEEARENARVARANQERADREAKAATRGREDVLRLSALQKLDDLVAEADRLWPAVPGNVPIYEEWLRKASELVAELPEHERKLAELQAKSVPWTEEEQAEQQARFPALAELESAKRHREHHEKLHAARASAEPPEDPAAEEVGVDPASLPKAADEVNDLAWKLIDPDREDYGGETQGLVLARHAVELAAELPPAERAGIRDSLAWALFANGSFDEAVAEEEKALGEAAHDRKEEFQVYLERLKEFIEEETDPEGLGQHLAELERRIAELEAAEVSLRPERRFADAQDKWWHSQLEKLVSGLRSFSGEGTGLFSNGISAEHGWSMEKRLGFALGMKNGFAPEGEYARAWSQALPEIRAAYPGLALGPQLGLLPISPDPSSGLWEFAHLQTGEPARRGPDGKLVLEEGTGLVFVLLPGGTFQMGAQRTEPHGMNHDPQAEDVESPVHVVTLSSFFLSKYEMTQGQWLRFVGRNPSAYAAKRAFGGKKTTLLHPVEQMTWATCHETLGRLGLVLPTEAQWEYTARAGTTCAWWTGSRKESLEGAANLSDSFAKKNGLSGLVEEWLDDGYAAHAPVGSFSANAFGLHDVAGNVREWCRDRSSDYRNPVRPGDGERKGTYSSKRVYRGGGFGVVASDARSAFRSSYAPEREGSSLGVRPARSIFEGEVDRALVAAIEGLGGDAADWGKRSEGFVRGVVEALASKEYAQFEAMTVLGMERGAYQAFVREAAGHPHFTKITRVWDSQRGGYEAQRNEDMLRAFQAMLAAASERGLDFADARVGEVSWRGDGDDLEATLHFGDASLEMYFDDCFLTPAGILMFDPPSSP